MTQRTVRKLSGLRIDEVSLVDRPANQHGLVAIAKRDTDQETPMTDLYTADGEQVDEADLQHGDVVYTDQGDELVYVEGDDAGDDYDEGDDEGDEVGKALLPLSRSKGKAALRLGGMRARSAGNAASAWGREAAGTARAKASDARSAFDAAADRGTQHVRRNRGRYGLGAGAAAGAGAGYGASRMKKSLGDAVLEELSKAYSEQDRDEVISKVADRVEAISKRNEVLEGALEQLLAEREEQQFVELAKGYELPGQADVIGGLLHRASQVLPPEDLDVLDRLFTSYGEVGKAAGGFYDELGTSGTGEVSVLGQVMGAAGDLVLKSEGNLSQEAAMTALFSANPAAYEEYEAEQRRGR